MSIVIEKLTLLRKLLKKKLELEKVDSGLKGPLADVHHFIKSAGSPSQFEIVNHFSSFNERTIRRYLDKLMKHGYVKRSQIGKLVHYRTR